MYYCKSAHSHGQFQQFLQEGNKSAICLVHCISLHGNHKGTEVSKPHFYVYHNVSINRYLVIDLRNKQPSIMPMLHVVVVSGI